MTKTGTVWTSAGVALKEDVSSVTPQGSCAETGGGACYNSLTMDALMAACLLMASAGKLGVVMLAAGWAGGQAAVCLCRHT